MDLETRELLAAKELGQKRTKLLTLTLVPIMCVGVGFGYLIGFLTAFIVIPLGILAARALVRACTDHWAQQLSHKHDVPFDRMRELAVNVSAL